MVMINIDDVNLINNINNVEQKNLSRIQLPETSGLAMSINNRKQGSRNITRKAMVILKKGL